ncbi:MAG TPA: class I adenylate-forming enzyme family protein [Solirubrobacterales bacterium]|nr:class I adenylate-forming enzyme family protein [Solirubrobacterales bacterium]
MLGLAVEHGARRTPHAKVHLDRPLDAFPDAGVSVDYTTVARLVREAEAALDVAGITPRQRVAIVKRNHIDVYLLATAVARLGAVPALLSAELDPVGLSDLLGRLRPDALLTDVATWTSGPLADLDPKLLPNTVLAVDGHPAGTEPLPSAPESKRPPMLPRSLEEPVAITHTSGTTGTPKLVVQTVRSFAEIVAFSVRGPKLMGLRETVGLHLAFTHWRSTTGAAGLLLAGWPAVVLSDSDPETAGALFEEHRPGVIESHPNTLIRWQGLAGRGGAFDNVRVFTSTFDAAHRSVIERLVMSSRRRNAMYLQVYGQSESGPITLRPYPRRLLERADGRCVGHAVPLYSRFRIATEGKRGREGRIEVRTRGMGATYLGEEAEFEAKLSDGWWDMTDVGYKSRWGCLHLLDRKFDQDRGVYSLLEVEDKLLQELPALTEVVLIPVEEGPPVPIVCTARDRPFDREQWRLATADLPPLSPPTHVNWDQVPRTETSKVRRFKVRESLAKGGI